MVVMNPKHRAITEKIWKVPEGTINPVMGSHFMKIMRDLEGRGDQVGLGAGEQSLAEREQREPLDRGCP